MPTELPPNHWRDTFDKQDKPGSSLATILLRQMGQDQDESGTTAGSKQASFWMVSAVEKLAQENPAMTLRELLSIFEETLPETVAEYRDYCRET